MWSSTRPMSGNIIWVLSRTRSPSVGTEHFNRIKFSFLPVSRLLVYQAVGVDSDQTGDAYESEGALVEDARPWLEPDLALGAGISRSGAPIISPAGIYSQEENPGRFA